MQPFIQQMIDEIRTDVLKQEGTELSNAKLRALLKDLNEKLYVITGEWNSEIIGDLEKFAAYETDWAAKAISNQLPDGINFVAPTPEQVFSAAKFNPMDLNSKSVDFTKLIDSWEDSEVERLTMAVKSGFVRGTPTQEIVRNIMRSGGLADISRRNAEAIVRTAVNHVSTQAKEQVYARNSDIITGYEWVSTLDSFTTPICRARDGEVYEIGKGPLPPAHYGCRSTTAPAVSSARMIMLRRLRLRGFPARNGAAGSARHASGLLWKRGSRSRRSPITCSSATPTQFASCFGMT